MKVITTQMKQESSKVLDFFLSLLLDKLVYCNKCLEKPDKVKVTRLSSFHKLELKWQGKI